MGRYGLTVVEYDAMLEAQGGLCAICGKKEPADRNMAVDHDHETGQIRSLLCTPCNVRLHALENEQWRAAAEAYLALWTSPIT